MVEEIIVDGQKKTLYVDGWLLKKIAKWLHDIKRDDDLVLCIDGKEGTGKSVFGMQLAKLLDPNFKLENICLNPDQFKKAIKEAKKGDAVMYDEAFTGLSSKGSLSQVNKILVEMMMEMRAKNLKVILVLPTFFMLEKYAAIFRSRCLFHVYKKRSQRGFWRYYNSKKKKMLYLLGKKFMSYAQPLSNRQGRFMNVYTVDEEAYRTKKKSAFDTKDRSSRNEKFKYQRDVMIYFLNQELGLTTERLIDFAYLFGIELDSSNLAKDMTAIKEKIATEIECPPTDEMITEAVTIINKRNRVTKTQTEIEKKEKRMAEILNQKSEKKDDNLIELKDSNSAINSQTEA